MQAVVKKVVYSFRYRLGPGAGGEEGVSHSLKAMWHTDVVAPMVMNRFPEFLRTN